MKHKNWILEDWEMEFQKDEIYSIEREKWMENEHWQWMEENRPSAKITLIKNNNGKRNEKIRRTKTKSRARR